MKERPILFSGEMVKAILAGKKTQTRRVVNVQPPAGYRQWGRCINGNVAFTDHPLQGEKGNVINIKGPYGDEGDHLWVRETWNYIEGEGYAYRASNPEMNGVPWRPSIFMPRQACRIKLEITGVRVERLKMISQADCIAEGIIDIAREQRRERQPGESPIEQFVKLWNQINAKRGYSWDANPWVWVIGFKPFD